MRAGLTLVGLEEISRNWFWFLVLGILSIILGVVALGQSVLVTLVSMLFLGILLLVNSIAEAVAAFQAKAWSGFFLHLLGAVLDVVVGIIFVTRPVLGAMEFTLVVAVFLFVGGLFRIVNAVVLRFPNWVFSAISGLIGVALALALQASWPWSGLQFVGICVAIDLIFRGWGMVMLSIALKTVATPRETTHTPAA